jgi:hypothetical protein
MAYRASVIGAKFSVERLLDSGTRVTCKLPHADLASQSHVAKN